MVRFLEEVFEAAGLSINNSQTYQYAAKVNLFTNISIAHGCRGIYLYHAVVLPTLIRHLEIRKKSEVKPNFKVDIEKFLAASIALIDTLLTGSDKTLKLLLLAVSG